MAMIESLARKLIEDDLFNHSEMKEENWYNFKYFKNHPDFEKLTPKEKRNLRYATFVCGISDEKASIVWNIILIVIYIVFFPVLWWTIFMVLLAEQGGKTKNRW